MKYKRLKCLFISVLFIESALFVSCKSEVLSQFNKEVFSVTYFSAENSDCIYVNFPDGKNMLIDCGEQNSKRANELINFIDEYGEGKIDYLFFTNPTFSHVGNYEAIINNCAIKKGFVPNLKNPINYSLYYPVYQLLLDNVNDVEYFDTSKYFTGENYFVAVLSPTPASEDDSLYSNVNLLDVASNSDINNVSAVIYLEYDGIRFLFLSSCGEKAQQKIMQDYGVGIYDSIYGNSVVKLEDVDFLKVSNHGAYGYSDDEFHRLLRAKNCVITVGGSKGHGYPHSSVVKLLNDCNENTRILRSDVDGNVRAEVEGGKIKIITDKGEK